MSELRNGVPWLRCIMECCVAIVVLPVYLELMSLVEKFCTINVPTEACDHEGSDAL